MAVRAEIFVWLIAGLYLAAIVRAQSGVEIDTEKIAKVKAAYLYNFAKFVQWPDSAFSAEDSPIVIGVFGNGLFGSILDDAVRGRVVGKRRFTIIRTSAGASDWRNAIRTCHILYVAESDSGRIDMLLDTLAGSPVLLVGEGESFASSGGTIGFALEQGRVVLHINREAAEVAKLKLGADLLSIARIVDSHNSGGSRRK